MSSLIFALMLQYVVSVKAGMVNHVQGDVSVKSTETVAAGVPIRTGAGGYAEILLNPGSFLRLGENSEAVLEGVELADIIVRAVSGPSIIEVTEIDDEFPITVTTGNLTAQIVQSGLYRFEDGKAMVLGGKVRIKESGAAYTYKKGWAVSNPVGGYRATKLVGNVKPTALETWSQNRSTLIANANVQTFQTFRNERASWSGSAWMWVPGFGAWTFMPRAGMVSPYGYRYRSYNERSREENNAFNGTSESNSSGRTASQPSVNPTNSTTSPTSPPPERAASRDEYLNRKDPVVEAPQP